MSNNKQSKKKRQSTIKFKELDKQYNQLNALSTHVVDKDSNKVIKYYSKFDTQKIEELIKELYTHVLYDKENNLNFFDSEDNFIKYYHFLTCKHFSHFKDEIGEQFETNINAMNMLISLGYFELFFSEIFDPNEVSKITDKINQSVELLGQVIEHEKKTKEDLSKVIQSDVIKNKFINE